MAHVGRAAVLVNDHIFVILPDISQVVHSVEPDDQAEQDPDTIISTLEIPYDNYFVIYTQPSAETSAKLVVAFFHNDALSGMLYAPELIDNWVELQKLYRCNYWINTSCNFLWLWFSVMVVLGFEWSSEFLFMVLPVSFHDPLWSWPESCLWS